ncbi:MAG: hypothetical protein HW389_3673 [Bacteroidetes bacterium]|nr:hypothetical protein [Bacteroidota bacterium]
MLFAVILMHGQRGGSSFAADGNMRGYTNGCGNIAERVSASRCAYKRDPHTLWLRLVLSES